jgi:NADH dehydrogenase/NADH:ubiquinone oxidoreductase subunit G
MHEMRGLLRELPAPVQRSHQVVGRAGAAPAQRRNQGEAKEGSVMKTVVLDIDGKKVEAEEGMTLLDAAKKMGVDIPTLCHDGQLAPFGACRICSVEIQKGKRSRVVASCVYPVEDGLLVKTDTPRIVKIRKLIIEFLLAGAPRAKVLEDLAARYGVKESRFEAEPTNCIVCGLCVRYCGEVRKAHALGLAGRGIARRIAFIPDIASRVCVSCRQCFPLCPTAKLPRETDGVCFAGLTVEDAIAAQWGGDGSTGRSA